MIVIEDAYKTFESGARKVDAVRGVSLTIQDGEIFGVIGYIFYKFSIPTAPFILASILGSMMESNFINSLVYTGTVSIFVQRPISLALLIVSVLFIVWPWLGPALKKVTKRDKTAA